MHNLFSSPRFAFIESLLVLLSGVVWVFLPSLGIWFTLIALLPWGLRLIFRKAPFRRTPFDWFMLVFLISAWVGYWAAYDKTSAWIKIWLIVTAILLYYALSAQPKQNLNPLALLSLCLGTGTCFYFFLTQSFRGNPGGIAEWWMNHRPLLGWPAIHHGYISGLIVITSLFAVYWLWDVQQKNSGRLSIPATIFYGLAFGINLFVFVLTVSRGIWAAMICGLGAWIIWKFTTSSRFISRPRVRSLFPVFILGYLCTILLLAYLGPARLGGGTGQENYGRNTRAELLLRSAYFLRDFPITGGGLDSFPGLYSQYMLVIPNFFFINSYNTFLDVGIEQGIIGGLCFLFIYLASIWLVSRTIVNTQSQQIRFLSWLSLFALVFTFIHGFFYDYLYNGAITGLLFFPVGFSMIGVIDSEYSRHKIVPFPEATSAFGKVSTRLILIVALFMTAMVALNSNAIISNWYSNLGAVKMAQAELRTFPTNQWATAENVPDFEIAEGLLRTSLRYNPNNETANYRLGMISLLHQDFKVASIDLETAYKQAPDHRGIIKNLGYAHLWQGDVNQAKILLIQIPEAQEELNVYAWWWKKQNRSDLSANSAAFVSGLMYFKH